MNGVLESLIAKYAPNNNIERENAIKEVMQEIALAGLSRGDFFTKAAFYGGTCLRIFHGLDRFSEDLDFALINKDKPFNLSDYYENVKKEFSSYGIEVTIYEKEINPNKIDMQRAFINSNSKMLLLQFFPNNSDVNKVIGNQLIKIKFEIDMDNPTGGITESRFMLSPSPYKVTIYDQSSLFAGKIAAVLSREYQHKIKGRDYYDYLFYISKGTKVNMTYLENKLKKNGKIPLDSDLDIIYLKKMLTEKFNSVDYNKAKEDVAPFIKDINVISLWSKELFLSTLESLEAKG